MQENIETVIVDNTEDYTTKQETNTDRLLDGEIVWLNTKEVCKLFKLSPATLYKWRYLRKLAFSKIERKIYYKREDLDAFLNIHYYKPYKI